MLFFFFWRNVVIANTIKLIRVEWDSILAETQTINFYFIFFDVETIKFIYLVCKKY
jgi:hypothetical protein